MAMEIRRRIDGGDSGSAHDGLILCVAYNQHRREISTGAQDNLVKTWLSETGEHVRTLVEHKGWVTGLAFSPELKVLFSCSIDGRVLVWLKGDLLQKVSVGSGKGENALPDGGGAGVKPGPLHCLAWDARRHSLVVGANGHIWVYAAIPETEMTPSTDIVLRVQSLLKDAHGNLGAENALVRSIITTANGRIYTVGYDRQLRMWDTDATRSIASVLGDTKKKPKGKGGAMAREMDKAFGNLRDAPKLKLMNDPERECHDGAISAMAFDADNNWVVTGGFDRQVKIWAGDAKKPVAVIDEKNGIDDTVTGLAYCPATRHLWMASNSASPLVYDPRSATDITPYLQQSDTSATAMRDAKERVQKIFRIEQTGELVATTSTRNLLIWRYNPYGACSILRGHTDWAEVLAYCYKKKPASSHDEEDDAEGTMVLVSGGADSVIRRWEPASRMNRAIYSQTETMAGHEGAVLCAVYCAAVDMFVTGGDDHTIRLWPMHDVDPKEAEMAAKQAAEMSDDEEAAASAAAGGGNPPAKQLPFILAEHTDRVTGMVCYGSTLGTVSWDLSIRLWDVERCIKDIKAGEEPKASHVIADAHDDYILACAHAPELGQLASASADQGVKLWDLSVDTEPAEPVKPQPGEEGGGGGGGGRGATVVDQRRGKRLHSVLVGHKADVSHCKWNAPRQLWVTGSEDHTVCCWTIDGIKLHELRPPGDAVTALAIDFWGHLLVASMDRSVRVYELPTDEEMAEWQLRDDDEATAERPTPEVVQVHLGHSDAVRSIVHVPEKQQYITASWDRTIRVWQARKAPSSSSHSASSGIAGATGGAAEGEHLGATGAGGEGEEGEGEEEFVPYAVKHRGIPEPKWLAERLAKGPAAAGGGFGMGASSKESKRTLKKKGPDDDALVRPQVTGLAAKINSLEDQLKLDLNVAPPEAKGATTDRRSIRRGGAAGRGNVRTAR